MMQTYNDEVEQIIQSGQVALKSRDIVVNEQSFEALLDAVHKASRVKPFEQRTAKTQFECLEILQRMKPEPFEGWPALMAQTIQNIAKLTPNPSEFDLAEAYGEISNHASSAIEILKRRIGAENGDALQKILKDPAGIESVRTYILIPMQRMITGFSTRSLSISKDYDLPPQVEQDANKNIQNHLDYLYNLGKRAKDVTLEKMSLARLRLSEAIAIIQKYVRPGYIIGGGEGISYIITSLIGGILDEFSDPDVIPKRELSERAVKLTDFNSQGAKQVLDVCMQNLRREGLNYTGDQIKSIIDRITEQEKVAFIKRFENKSPQEKAMEKMFKNLGLGEWAVGGTEGIRKLKDTQYLKDELLRQEMGFQELVTQPTENLGDEAGYAHENMAEDDY